MLNQARLTMNEVEANSQERPIDLELVRRTVAAGATDDELAMYLHDCQRRGVHPLDRLLHFTIHLDKSGSRKYTPITSIDLFRARAANTGEHAGTDDAVYITDDGTQFPQTASVTVYRVVKGVRCPFTATARWKEYKPSKDFMWLKMPYTMLAKCAEALALRKAFPAELGGLYTADEMAQAPAIDPNLTIEANGFTPAEQAKALAARAANPPVPVSHPTQQQRDAINTISAQLGIRDEYAKKIFARYDVKRLGLLTEAQAAEVVLELSQLAVEKLLAELTVNLDDVRNMNPAVVADVPGELDQEQADAALTILRQYKVDMEANA